MSRSIVAVVLCVAFAASALTLPFTHAHTDGHAGGHHAPHAVHSHLAGHTSHAADRAHHAESPAIGNADHDDQPVYLQLFVAVGAQAAPVGATPLAVFALPTPAERRALAPVVVVHGHDPPLSPSLAPRAPPSLS